MARWAILGGRRAAVTLEAKLELIAPKRLILTHKGDDMVGLAARLPHETAGYGKGVAL